MEEYSAGFVETLYSCATEIISDAGATDGRDVLVQVQKGLAGLSKYNRKCSGGMEKGSL
jgi:hypothetical protein